MLLHSWMLVLLLCCSLLSVLHAASLASVTPHQAWTESVTQHGNRAEASDQPSTRSFWPFWDPTGGTGDSRTTSFSLLPFNLDLNFWSSSSQSEDYVSEPDHFTPVLASSPISYNKQGSTGPSTQSFALWDKSYSSVETRASFWPEHATTVMFSNGQPSDNASPRNTESPSPLPESQRPAAALTTKSRSLNNPLLHTERVATWESTHPQHGSSILAALLTPVVTSTFPAPQEARSQPGIRPETGMGLLDDGNGGQQEQQAGEETTTNANKDVHEDLFKNPTQMTSVSTTSPSGTPPAEDFPTDVTVKRRPSAPGQPVDPVGIEKSTTTQSAISTESNATSNETTDELLLLPPSMFVPLYSDWNSAMATWGLAWEAHVYGLGSIFALVALLSTFNLLCLPVHCPSGCGYFILVNLFLLVVGVSRGFSLFYDAYSHQEKLPVLSTLLLYEAPFPCLTAAFGIVFLLLSMRSRLQLPRSILHQPCFLAALVLLHFGATFGSMGLLHVFPQLPCLFLVSQGAFVVLTAFLATTYFVFYCYVQVDSKHIYHLNNVSPPAEHYSHCPFANARDWVRAAVTTAFAGLFALACAGLRLYSMLHALGLVGVEVFHPWPWWAFHLSCQLCEIGLCLALALVVMHPVCSSSKPPRPRCCPPTSCGPRNSIAKQPILPNNYSWANSQPDKLVSSDTVSRSECERLPLYPMVSHHLSSVDGLDLLCTSEPSLDLPGRHPSLNLRLCLDTDSTADLRPPSPINLRRSINEALFSEALFPRSFFNLPRPRSPSGLSLGAWSVSDGRPFRRNLVERPLYRTSSCTENDVSLPIQPHFPTSSSPSSSHTVDDISPSAGWRQDSSCASLNGPITDTSSAGPCSSPEGQGFSSHSKECVLPLRVSQDSVSQHSSFGRRYQSTGPSPQPPEEDLAIQVEFINVCRQIDALSICSDTIDL